MSMLEITEHNQIVTISLNNPGTRNALDSELIAELTQAFKNLHQRTDIRLVYLKGNGKSFCAGANLEVMRNLGKGPQINNQKEAEALYDLFYLGSTLPMPTLTKVHGHVYGGGLGLVAISDIVVAHEDTKLCFSETRLGLIPAVISSFCLRKMQAHHARYLMMTASPFTARQAQEMGLVYFAGNDSSIDQFLQQTQQSLLEAGPVAVRELKALLEFVEQNFNQEALIKKTTTAKIANLRASQEGQEGMTAFLEKRLPSWSHQ